MLTEIGTALGGIPSNYAISISQDYDIFEGYLFALLVEEAKNAGASVVYQDNSSTTGTTPLTTCTFRTSPGAITSTDPYTYAVIRFPGKRKPTLEAHVGVFVVGKSTVKHECDIALILRSEAEACRQYHRTTSRVALPRSSNVLLAIECKYYDKELGINLARSFIGLVQDLGTKDAFFVTNKDSPSPAKLLSNQGKRLNWQPSIYPNPVDTNAVDRIRGLFKDVFKHYLASK
jgi:hypothetical protein